MNIFGWIMWFFLAMFIGDWSGIIEPTVPDNYDDSFDPIAKFIEIKEALRLKRLRNEWRKKRREMHEEDVSSDEDVPPEDEPIDINNDY
jgi:hypothetical protein